MATGKKRTTMAKLNRETKMREKRHAKEARKEARKREQPESRPDRPDWLGDPIVLEDVPAE